MRFKKLKKVISKTDSISVLLTNDGGDEAQTFLTKKDIPKKFNNMEVVGIGSCKGIKIDKPEFKGQLFTGIEVLLDDPKEKGGGESEFDE